MPTVFDYMLAPLNQLIGNTAELDAPKQATEIGYLANPAKANDPVQDKVIMQRFLQQFEYVELDYPMSGMIDHPEQPIGTHPHLHFRMCGEDRAKMDHDQTLTYLSREIDRGTYLLKKMGLEIEDFYVSPEKGELRFDAKVPKLPENMTERHVLEALTDGLQQACSEARANRKATLSAS